MTIPAPPPGAAPPLLVGREREETLLRTYLTAALAGLAALQKRAGRPDQDERIRARIELQTLLDGIGDEHLQNTLLQTPHAQAVMTASAAPRYPNGLSVREVEVLRLIAGGQTNQEIAATLFLSVRTVERHITSLYRKINVNGRADATAYAIRHRLFDDARLIS